jgi:hypothetical protein
MSSLSFAITFIFLMTSCSDTTSKTKSDTAITHRIDSSAKAKTDTLPSTFDTTLTVFKDTSYKLTLHVFDTESFNEEKSNSTVLFNYVRDDKAQLIFRDSFYCMNPLIDFEDYNNDRIKDVLFFYYTGARANPTYHLYLVDTLKHKLTYVKGFEDLPNPVLDSVNNIISSSALYGGKAAVSFYRISSKLKLINLGHPFDADLGDDEPFDKAVKQIVKEKGK